jgi:hypothetical protein
MHAQLWNVTGWSGVRVEGGRDVYGSAVGERLDRHRDIATLHVIWVAEVSTGGLESGFGMGHGGWWSAAPSAQRPAFSAGVGSGRQVNEVMTNTYSFLRASKTFG